MRLTERQGLDVEGVASLVGAWDRPRLTRALQNLIGNAAQYSPEGVITNTVERKTAPRGELAVIRVADRGVGIPSADLPRIFEQFRRGSNVIGLVGGTGIGLFSVRQIVEQHGGTVTVESREGQGSTFTISVPLQDTTP